MTRLSQIKRLRFHFQDAPKANRAKMENVVQKYTGGAVNNFKTLQNAMIALAHPGMYGPKKVMEYYNKAMGMQIQKKLVAKLNLNYTLRVLLFTSSSAEPTRVVNALNEEERQHVVHHKPLLDVVLRPV